MYHVIGTSLIFLLLYFLSLFFSHNGFYDLSIHRKIWNSVLAITFLSVALAGFFMALQINYKWNVPYIKEILKWHVEIGAGLALTGLFHLSWHLTYFTKIFKEKTKSPDPGLNRLPDLSSVTSGLFVTGFTSTSVQILLAREIMNISGGYELIAGVFLGSWLIASAAGAAVAGISSLSNIKKISLFFAVTPFVSLLLLLLFARFFTGAGETPSFLVSMIFTFVVLLPFCFISGFTFIKLLSAKGKLDQSKAGSSYSLETIAGAAAGVLLSVLTAGSFNTYKLLLVILFLSLAFTLLAYYVAGDKKKSAVKLFFTVLISFIIIGDPDIVFRRFLLPGIKITSSMDTPYGNITKGEYSGEQSLFYNQRLLNYSNDVIEREEDIHYAMLQRKQHNRVIIISSDISSLLPEIRKYKPSHITFIERDPALIDAKADQVKMPPDVTLQNEDAWSYIRKNKEVADAIIMLIAPPSTLSLNRYYSDGFFRSVRKSLSRGGVFICSPAPGDDYLNNEAVSLCSSVYNTLTAIFRYVKPVAGHKLWFIASDEDISVSFCRLVEEQGIKNIYVGPDYLSDDLTEAKSKEVINAMKKSIRPNTSSFPVAALQYQSYNLGRNLAEKIPAILLMILLFVLPLAGVRRRNLLMCTTASALAGFEIISLLAIQLAAGNMYQLTGLTLALFMTGLSAGSGLRMKISGKHRIKIILLMLALFYILAGLFLVRITEMKSEPAAVTLILLSAIVPSVITGMIFRWITEREPELTSASRIYFADLAGSAFGFIAVSAVMVPLCGITSTLFILSAFIFTGLIVGTTANKL